MRNKSKIGRRRTIPVVLPNSIRTDSDDDLRLELVTLKNAQVTVAVHIQRIERELARRGSHTQMLGYSKE
ncbi:MAG: hypothetical protein ACFFCK_06775 [Promethearchaeota archaeon]